MNLKTWAPLVVAVGLGVAAAVVARNVLVQRAASQTQQQNTVSVVVARGPIGPGQELTTEQLMLASIAAKTPPPETFISPAQLVGRVTMAPIVAGQTIQQSLLAPKGTPGGLQALVPQGMRAITLEVNESSGLAGLLLPGAHVDVVTTAMNQGRPEKAVSRAIVQNVPVIAVGQRLSGPKPEGEKESAASRTVTLLVAPREAEALDLAMTTARLRLVLRARGDNTQSTDEGVMFADLAGPQETEQPAVAITPQPPATQPVAIDPPVRVTPAVPHFQEAPRQRVVTIINGEQEHQVVFREEKPAQSGVADIPGGQAIP